MFITIFKKLLKKNIRNYATTVDNALNPSSQPYIEELYVQWLKDPNSVGESWRKFFDAVEKGQPYNVTYNIPPPKNEVPVSVYLQAQGGAVAAPAAAAAAPVAAPKVSPGPLASVPPPATRALDPKANEAAEEICCKITPSSVNQLSEEQNVLAHMALYGIVRNYQNHGHVHCSLSPIDHMYTDRNASLSERLGQLPESLVHLYDVKPFLDKSFQIPSFTRLGEGQLPFKEIIKRLELVYCHHMGIEYMHIEDPIERHWLRTKLELPGALNFTKEQKIQILQRVAQATLFEAFLAKKWPTDKRFGLEGCDSLIPCLLQIIDTCSAAGVENINIGLAHRGRLNTLANVTHKKLASLFSLFGKITGVDDGVGSGDVKYHLGAIVTKKLESTGKNMKITVLSNPSHLECIAPIVIGKVRGEQQFMNDLTGEKSMAIVIHGDSANAGQGVGFETVNMSMLKGYTTHGVIHIVTNNQVGFTTLPTQARSPRYCTAVNAMLECPVFHVNNDDPEAVVNASRISAEYRSTFRKDATIDIVGYRKLGHNETDEPMYTQPHMYKKVAKKTNTMDYYLKQLIAENVITQQEFQGYIDKFNKNCEDEFEQSKSITRVRMGEWLDTDWSSFFKGKNRADYIKGAKTPTGVSEDVLKHVGNLVSTPPPGDFVVHKGISRLYSQRKQMVDARQADWALGEALAMGALLKEKIHVRLSGQDVERGTFSHRHHVVHHQEKENTTYTALNNVSPDQAFYSVTNSPLSEYAVLGFELGYSAASPHMLIIWEAQFGDFANTAQCIIDQFLSAGEDKWKRQSGLVVLLPHGMEGMGPEHSSCRLERFLQLCNDDPDTLPKATSDVPENQLIDCNWIVINCSTPANVFHAWRRQVIMPFRKPLIHASPKSLLRHPMAKSSFDDMKDGTSFQRIIPDNGPASKNPDGVKKLVFCSGKVYYDLLAAIQKAKLDNSIALTRVEQLFPFPYDLLKQEIGKYSKAKLVWCQEEHKNFGPYPFVFPRFKTLLGGKAIEYNGRPANASPAVGFKLIHEQELQAFMKDVMTV